jgi:hypothetical protein
MTVKSIKMRVVHDPDIAEALYRLLQLAVEIDERLWPILEHG